MSVFSPYLMYILESCLLTCGNVSLLGISMIMQMWFHDSGFWCLQPSCCCFGAVFFCIFSPC